MAYTYSKLAETNVGAGGTSAITFNNIPQNYTDLIIKLSARSTGTGDLTTYVDMIINGNTGAFYNQRNISGMLNSTVTNQTWANQNSFYVYQINTSSSTANTFSNSEVYLPNYSGSNPKSISVDGVSESNTSSSNSRGDALVSGLYNQSGPSIVSLKFTASGGNFAQYSTATLYGIRVEL